MSAAHPREGAPITGQAREELERLVTECEASHETLRARCAELLRLREVAQAAARQPYPRKTLSDALARLPQPMRLDRWVRVDVSGEGEPFEPGLPVKPLGLRNRLPQDWSK